MVKPEALDSGKYYLKSLQSQNVFYKSKNLIRFIF